MSANQRLYVELVANATGLRSGMRQGSQAVEQFGRDVDRVGKSSVASIGKIATVGTSVGVIVGKATNAIVNGFMAAAHSAVEFDTQMRNVQSITKVNDKQLGAMGGQLLELSKHLPQSASTLAEGLYDVASSGFQGADGLKVLTAAATAASAGMTDTSTAGQAITAVLNAYGKGAGEAADVSDTLFQTVNLGVTTFAALAHNVGDYLGQAQALGISFEQTQSAIATLTLTGTTQMQAGTALGAVLNSLIRPSIGLAKALKQAGFESGTAALKALGLRGTLLKLRDGTDGSAESMGNLFTDSQALRSALQLTSNNGEKWAAVAGQIEDKTRRAGAAHAALTEQAKGAAFQLGILKNEAMAAGITAATLALPYVIKGLHELSTGGAAAGHALSDVADALGPTWQHLVEIFRDSVEVFSAIGHLIGPLAAGLGKLSVGGLVGGLNALTSALSGMSGFLADHKTLVAAVTVAYLVQAGAATALASATTGRLAVAYYNTMRAAAGARASIIAMTASEEAAAAAGAALGARLATLAIAGAQLAILTAGIVSISKQLGAASRGADMAKASFDELSKMGKIGDADQMRGVTAAMELFIEQQDKAAFGGSNLTKAWHLVTGQMATGSAAAEAMGRRLEDLTAKEMAAEGNLVRLSQVLPLTKQQLLDLANAAGIDLSGNIDTVGTAIEAYYNKTVAASAPTQNLATAVSVLSDKATDAKSKVDALKQGLDALIGVNINAEQAAIKYEQAIDDLTASVIKNGHHLDIHGEKGRNNRQAFETVATSITDVITALADQGVGMDRLGPKYRAMVDGLVKTATKAGFTKGEINKLLQSYGLTPKAIDTLVTEHGAAATKAKLQGIYTAGRQAATPINIPIQLTGLAGFVSDIGRAKQAATVGRTAPAAGLPGLLLPGGLHADGGAISGPGTGTSDSIPALLSNGEYVLRASAVRKLGVPTLDRMNRFASGGLVIPGPSRYNARTSLSSQALTVARRGGSPDDIRALSAAYDDYLHKLDQAAQREKLLGDIHTAQVARGKASAKERAAAQQQVLDAQKALRDFDQAAVVEREKAATDRLISSLERQAQLRQGAAQAAADRAAAQNAINDNMYAVGARTATQQIALLDKRMAAEKKYSDEWMSLYRQREQVLQDVADAEQTAADAAQKAADDAQNAFDQQLSDLNHLLDQRDALQQQLTHSRDAFTTKEQELLARQAQAEQTLYAGMAKAAADHATAEGQILAQRAQALTSWASISERATVGWGNTVGQLQSNVTDQIALFTEWMDTLASARARGVSDGVIAALGLDQGPQALGQLRQFTNATQAEVDGLNAAVAQRTAVAGEEVHREQMAGYGQLGADLLAAQQQYTGAVEQLQSDYQAAVAQTAADLLQAQQDFAAEQADFTAQLAALGSDQGRSWSDAIAQGIASGIPGIAAAAAAARAAMDTLTAAQSALAGGAGSSSTTASTPTAASGKAFSTALDPAVIRGMAESAWTAAQRRYADMHGLSGTRVFDTGGWLQPGYTLAYNGTGRAERVLTAAQHAASSSPTVLENHTYVVVDGQIIDHKVERKLATQKGAAQIAGAMP